MIDRNGGRRGFTLLEIFVVIVVLALLVAILLPAVQFAREASRRVQCSNNLHQLGTALHARVAETGNFPEGCYYGGFSVLVELLPHLEQKPLFDTINLSINSIDLGADSPNQTVYMTPVSMFLCPSDRLPALGGWTNYAGNRGVGVQKYGYNGAFALLPGPIGMRDFTDGTSQTAAMSEWLLGPERGEVKDAKRTVFELPVRLVAPEQFDQFTTTCRDLDIAGAMPSPGPKGAGWIIGEFGNTQYNHTLEINAHTCLNGTAVQTGAWTAGSLHSRGVNVLFADGHVHFVAEGVSLNVWRALGSRNGGESLSGDSY